MKKIGALFISLFSTIIFAKSYCSIGLSLSALPILPLPYEEADLEIQRVSRFSVPYLKIEPLDLRKDFTFVFPKPDDASPEVAALAGARVRDLRKALRSQSKASLWKIQGELENELFSKWNQIAKAGIPPGKVERVLFNVALPFTLAALGIGALLFHPDTNFGSIAKGFAVTAAGAAISSAKWVGKRWTRYAEERSFRSHEPTLSDHLNLKNPYGYDQMFWTGLSHWYPESRAWHVYDLITVSNYARRFSLIAFREEPNN